MPATYHGEGEKAAAALIERLGKKIVIGVPLGLGKPIGLLNALYRLAEQDSSLSLTIITGLTLARPLYKNELEKRFLAPILERMLQDYEEPRYERPRQLGLLPANIRVIEFFLAPGVYLGNAKVQQDYISSNYTSAVADAMHYQINVFAQTVTPSAHDPDLFSLSSNSDLFAEALAYLKTQQKVAIVAEVNAKLPFMPGDDATVRADIFSDILDTKSYRHLFPLPREELSAEDHLIGLYTSALIDDGSCIQIGIGRLNNAITAALILRHKDNITYRDLLRKLLIEEQYSAVLAASGSLLPFKVGLYASTEMLSDDYLELYKAGILKKRVYDHLGLQELLNAGEITEEVNPALVEKLVKKGLIGERLSERDLAFLLHFGIFKPGCSYKLDKPLNSSALAESLGDKLKTGKCLHAGFFLGTEDFYQQLKSMANADLEGFAMTSVARTNSLAWSYELAKAQRQNARFVNFAMMLTLGGAVVADGLSNMQEVSGVGGQFNFVNMALSLPRARSIIACRSTRETHKGIVSNIVWEYPNMTLPRHLRDIFVTEYGIADCRSLTDSEVIKALLNISDSRFQEGLLQQAKSAGKLAADYQIPSAYRDNTPEALEILLKEVKGKGYCQAFPFGSDLTAEELVLSRALLFLKKLGPYRLVFLALRALFLLPGKRYQSYLQRMQLAKPKQLKFFLYQRLLILALRQTRALS